MDGLIQLKQYHIEIVKNLFGNDSFEIEETINKLFEELSGFLNQISHQTIVLFMIRL